ncbi:MAG: ComF family protein [Micrococcales bacterium]
MIWFWFPQRCCVCGEPSKPLCGSCEAGLVIRYRTVARPGLDGVASCADYEGSVAALIHAFKEGGSAILGRRLAQPMAEVLLQRLSMSGARGTGARGPGAPPNSSMAREAVVLVPAPSRRSATRRRGFVPAAVLARLVARRLGKAGISTRVWDGLRVSAQVEDQSRLGRHARAENVAGRMRTVGAPGAGLLVLLDDIVTTGATLIEAKRALCEAGLTVALAVTFAETL